MNALMWPILIEIDRVFFDHPRQMRVIMNENMIQTFSSQTAVLAPYSSATCISPLSQEYGR